VQVRPRELQTPKRRSPGSTMWNDMLTKAAYPSIGLRDRQEDFRRWKLSNGMWLESDAETIDVGIIAASIVTG